MSGKGKDKSKDKDKELRPFKCQYAGCKWTFARQEHATRHLRTHSGERPHACYYDKCPSRFARNDELRRHIRLVHEYDRDTSHEAALADSDKVVYNGHNRRQSEQVTSIPSSSSAGRIRHVEVPSIHASSSRTQLPPRPATSMNYYSQSTAYAMPPPPMPSSSRQTVAQPSPFYEEEAPFIPVPQSSSQHAPPSSMPPSQIHSYQMQNQSMYPQSTYSQSTYPQSYTQPTYSHSTYNQPTYSQSTHSSSMYAPSMQAPQMQTQAQPPPMQYQYQYPSAAAASRSQRPVLPPLQQFDGYVTDTGIRERERERRVQLPGFSEIARHPNEDPDPRHRRYHQ